jgi:hypothetical protein
MGTQHHEGDSPDGGQAENRRRGDDVNAAA